MKKAIVQTMKKKMWVSSIIFFQTMKKKMFMLCLVNRLFVI